MKKLSLKDILDIAEYEKIRTEYRKRIMSIKNARRIFVGPTITYLFENYDTMHYQVEEMMRAERIVNDNDIMQEINAYNELIPDQHQLSTSMFIEINDKEKRTNFLKKVLDLPEHTFISVNGNNIKAQFDPRQGSSEQLSSVQYVKFNLSENDVKEFNNESSTIKLFFTHPEYSYEYQLTNEEKLILFEDLTN